MIGATLTAQSVLVTSMSGMRCLLCWWYTQAVITVSINIIRIVYLYCLSSVLRCATPAPITFILS